MRIGIDGNEANIEKRVGSNVYAYQLLSWFHKLDKSSNFTVYLKSQPLDDLPKKGEKWQYRILKPANIWTRWRLPLDLYVHRPKPTVFFTPGHYAPKFCPGPLAISVMDLSFLHFPEMFRKQDAYKLINWTRESILKANHIFTISQFTKNDIINNYSFPEEKITVTYPGYHKKRFAKEIKTRDIEKAKEKYKIDRDYLIYIGTLQPRKNIIRLIRAFAKVKRDDLKLVISGKKGWMYSKMLSEGKRLGIENNLVFTDYVDENDAPLLIKGARALILVSLYEGFGIPVLEAMALGVPTVVSNISSLPEITQEVGIKVNPLSVKSVTRGMTRVLQLNKEERNEISVKSKKRAKKFSWKKSAEKTLEVLHELAV